jgi:hypothetical protein
MQRRAGDWRPEARMADTQQISEEAYSDLVFAQRAWSLEPDALDTLFDD